MFLVGYTDCLPQLSTPDIVLEPLSYDDDGKQTSHLLKLKISLSDTISEQINNIAGSNTPLILFVVDDNDPDCNKYAELLGYIHVDLITHKPIYLELPHAYFNGNNATSLTIRPLLFIVDDNESKTSHDALRRIVRNDISKRSTVDVCRFLNSNDDINELLSQQDHLKCIECCCGWAKRNSYVGGTLIITNNVPLTTIIDGEIAANVSNTWWYQLVHQGIEHSFDTCSLNRAIIKFIMYRWVFNAIRYLVGVPAYTIVNSYILTLGITDVDNYKHAMTRTIKGELSISESLRTNRHHNHYPTMGPIFTWSLLFATVLGFAGSGAIAIASVSAIVIPFNILAVVGITTMIMPTFVVLFLRGTAITVSSIHQELEKKRINVQHTPVSGPTWYKRVVLGWRRHVANVAYMYDSTKYKICKRIK